MVYIDLFCKVLLTIFSQTALGLANYDNLSCRLVLHITSKAVLKYDILICISCMKGQENTMPISEKMLLKSSLILIPFKNMKRAKRMTTWKLILFEEIWLKVRFKSISWLERVYMILTDFIIRNRSTKYIHHIIHFNYFCIEKLDETPKEWKDMKGNVLVQALLPTDPNFTKIANAFTATSGPNLTIQKVMCVWCDKIV